MHDATDILTQIGRDQSVEREGPGEPRVPGMARAVNPADLLHCRVRRDPSAPLARRHADRDRSSSEVVVTHWLDLDRLLLGDTTSQIALVLQ